MSSIVNVPKGKLPSNQADLWFENNAVGLMKKEIWEMSEAQLKASSPSTGCPRLPANGQAARTSRPRRTGR